MKSIRYILDNYQLDNQHEVRYLLQFVLCMDHMAIICNMDDYILNTQEIMQFDQIFELRKSGYPFAYIVNKKEFYGRDFYVNQDVLIPRYETELIIDLALNAFHQILLKHFNSNNNCINSDGINSDAITINILDLGTGSGIIAITLYLEVIKIYQKYRLDHDIKQCQLTHRLFPHLQVNIVAVDRSLNALYVAKKNSIILQALNIQFVLSDWYSALSNEYKFDMIISNPPYVDYNSVHYARELQYEPTSALCANYHDNKENILLDNYSNNYDKHQSINNNIAHKDILHIIKHSVNYLNKYSVLLIEHGFDQADIARQCMIECQFCDAYTAKDYGNLERVTYGWYLY